MFCSKCGKEILDGSKFCSFCGSEVAVQVAEPEPEPEPEVEIRRPVYENISWDVKGYPETEAVSKTEDIDFDWSADPKDIRDRYTRGLTANERAEVKAKADLGVEDIIPAAPAPAPEPAPEPVSFSFTSEELSPSEKVDKFYTFSKKNEEFQQLLNREYDKIKGGNLIQHEKTAADKSAAIKFEERPQTPTMEEFLEKEGLNRIYEPKAVESDVLQRIEAQDRKREEERREEEARQKALEEARLKAEAEMRAAEEARLKAEEEARRLAEEEAARKAEEEARQKALEEARLRAEEEARRAEEEARKAEEEARLAAERQARIQAAEEARLAAEQEQARLQAEAELRAQQEAEKIRQQQEARQKALEEERKREELARQEAEKEMLRNRLIQDQQNRALEVDSAAAAEEARKVLQQTARMKKEEQDKIRAALAGIKADATVTPVPAVPVEPEPVPETVAPEIPVAEPVAPVVEPVAEPVAPDVAPVVEPIAPAEPVEPAPVAGIDKNEQAHQATQENLSAMEKARREFLAEFGIDPIEEPKPEPVKAPARPTPTTMEELLGEKPVTGRDAMLAEGSDMAATRVIDKSAVLAGLQNTMVFEGLESLEKVAEPAAPAVEPVAEPAAPAVEPVAEPATPAEPVAPVEPEVPVGVTEVAEIIPEAATVEDLLNQFENNTMEEGFAAKEEPSLEPNEGAEEAVKPGLDNTMVMPSPEFDAEVAAADFDNYGEKEAEELKRLQEAEAAPEAEAVQKEAVQEEVQEEAEEGKEKGGAGRVVLKVLLILLIIIFAVELAGIGIKFLAPNSHAAEVIDNQLNKVIHLITGSVTDYSVPGTDYEV